MSSRLRSTELIGAQISTDCGPVIQRHPARAGTSRVFRTCGGSVGLADRFGHQLVYQRCRCTRIGDLRRVSRCYTPERPGPQWHL